MAAPARFERAIAGVKVRCLCPLGDGAIWYSRRDSNSRDLTENQASSPLDDRNGGAPGRHRTCDAQLFELPLYRLSYRGLLWSPGPESNRRRGICSPAHGRSATRTDRRDKLSESAKLAAPARFERAIAWVRTRCLCRLATGL